MNAGSKAVSWASNHTRSSPGPFTLKWNMVWPHLLSGDSHPLFLLLLHKHKSSACQSAEESPLFLRGGGGQLTADCEESQLVFETCSCLAGAA